MKSSELLALDDLRTKVVDVPGWKQKLTIRELGLDEGIKLFSMAQESNDKLVLGGEDIARVIAWGVIDPDTRERVFSDADIPALAKKNRKALMFLYQEITALSGDDAEKN